MKQPLNFAAATKCTPANLAVGYEVAPEDRRTHWNSDDFLMKRFGTR